MKRMSERMIRSVRVTSLLYTVAGVLCDTLPLTRFIHKKTFYRLIQTQVPVIQYTVAFLTNLLKSHSKQRQC